MVRSAVKALTAAILCLLVTASDRGRLQAAGQVRSEGPKTATAGQLLISEFRLRGANGAQDEFIEIYNATLADHTVAALSGTGYGIAASDGVTRCTIPNGTIIPKAGHFLCVNSAGYSLGSYPAGSVTTATGDATYTTDIPDNAGIAIFNNDSGGGSYSVANRLDAAGSTSEGNTTYKEGTGYPALAALDLNASFVRRNGGCTGYGGGSLCNSALLMKTTTPSPYDIPLDNNSNAVDFFFVDTSGTDAGAGQRLGAPGPENLSSPITVGGTPSQIPTARLDTCASPLASPNKVRDFTSDPSNNATFGTLELRWTWTNNTGNSLTRLRFRIADMSTLPAPAGVADFRPRTSTDVSVVVDRPPCGTGTSSVTVHGTTLEQPPNQTKGSGLNGSLSVGTVTAATPLANHASIDVRFVLGVEQAGVGRFCVFPETLPGSLPGPACFIGNSDSNIAQAAGDYDFDQIADVALYNPTGLWTYYYSSSGFSGYRGFSLIAGYEPVPGDFDGDGRLDEAMYRESTGEWRLFTSSTAFVNWFTPVWGGPGYKAVAGDYDGDGCADVAVYSASTGNWSVLTSTTGFTGIMTINWGGNGYTAVGGLDVDGDKRSDLVVYNERLGSWYVLKSSTNFTTALTIGWGGPGYTLVPGDYDGDGKADFGLYQRSTGYWYILESSTNYIGSMMVSFGGMGFVPMPGDYDGDGKFDIAVYQAAASKFFGLTSSSSYSQGSAIIRTIGTTSDLPVTSAVVPRDSREIDLGDFDGDAQSDITVYQSATGLWSTLKSSGSYATATSTSWGGSGYAAAPGDYDGDGKGDLGLYQPSTGLWLVLLSSTNFTTSLTKSAGGPGYTPMPGDYDGDGKTDPVVYNPTTGLWYGLKSSTNYTSVISVSWGGAGYHAVPGDFDGDGVQDLGVYQASTGNWSILTSSSGYTAAITRNLGGSGYAAVPADFDGDGFTDFAVYQSSTGQWTVLKSSSGNTLAVTASYGGSGYVPVAGDWDGDGRAEIGVYNSATGAWSMLLSSGAYTISLSKNWGGTGYQAIQQFP